MAIFVHNTSLDYNLACTDCRHHTAERVTERVTQLGCSKMHYSHYSLRGIVSCSDYEYEPGDPEGQPNGYPKEGYPRKVEFCDSCKLPHKIKSCHRK